MISARPALALLALALPLACTGQPQVGYEPGKSEVAASAPKTAPAAAQPNAATTQAPPVVPPAPAPLPKEPRPDIAYEPPFNGAPQATQRLPSGITIEDFTLGAGEPAAAGAEVEVHYTGYLTDGTVFDTSRKRGRPFGFELGAGRVIQGWDQGIAGMKVGGQRRLIIPAELGYGARQAGKIPPNATLVFTVELSSMTAPLPPPQPIERYSGAPAREQKLPGGLLVTDYQLGEGAEAKAGDEVQVHYRGTLDDGTEFDNSHPRGKPIKFTLGVGMVVKGWDQGIAGMKVGGLRKLVIPADLAYGERARGKIPANAQLTFTVELMSVKPGLAPPPPPPAPSPVSPGTP
jgi:FKBP-type peptidyl-prolyl cis-trans isomerase